MTVSFPDHRKLRPSDSHHGGLAARSMNQTVIDEDSTATQEHFARAARTGQEAVSSAIRTWGETTQSMLGLGSTRGPAPTLGHLIEGWFDTAEEVLRAQREFTEGLLGLGKPAVQAMARAAQQTSDVIEQSTHNIPESSQAVGRTHSRQRSAAHNGGQASP
jgi:hypothetical protein